MELGMDPSTARTLCKAAQCAARIGSEILLEVVAAESLSVRSLNTSRSAFFNVKLRVDAFEYFRVNMPCVQVAVSTKAFLAALRTPKVQYIRITLEGRDNSMLCLQLESENTGLRKKYSLPVLSDVEFLSASIDKSTYAARFISKPETLNRLLASFQAGPSDVTVTCKPAGSSKSLLFSSHSDSAREAGLQTQLELDSGDEDIEYHYHGQTPKHLSFNLKDFKAMVAFCSDCTTDVVVHLDEPGRPVIVVPSFRRWTQRTENFVAEMVLATMEDTSDANSEATQSQRSNDRPLPNITEHPRAAGAAADTLAPPATTLIQNPEPCAQQGVCIGTNVSARLPSTSPGNWMSEHEKTRWRNQYNDEQTYQFQEPNYAPHPMTEENIQAHAHVFTTSTDRHKPGERSSHASSDEDEDSEFVAATPPEKRGRVEM